MNCRNKTIVSLLLSVALIVPLMVCVMPMTAKAEIQEVGGTVKASEITSTTDYLKLTANTTLMLDTELNLDFIYTEFKEDEDGYNEPCYGLTITGDHTLTIDASEWSDRMAVYVTDLTIKSGTVNVYKNNAGDYDMIVYGAIRAGNTTIDGGTLTAIGRDRGIIGDTYVQNGGTVTLSTRNRYGDAIWVNDLTVNKGTLQAHSTGRDSQGVFATNFRMNGGTVDAAGLEAAIDTFDSLVLGSNINIESPADAVVTDTTINVGGNKATNVLLKEIEPGETGFTDVPKSAFYHDPVKWAVENGITDGITPTTFEPGNPCTRAQAVTFLWRAAGKPAASDTAVNFTDIDTGSYYAQAVAWAVAQNITQGTSSTTFTPEKHCSRGEIVTFLYRYKNRPEVTASATAFTDVPTGAFYAAPVAWALDAGITRGTSDTTFSPEKTCSRGEIVTFLYRAR